MKYPSSLFIWFIILFLLIVILSFIPAIRTLFANAFDSTQFKAIRLVLICFGIIGFILGILNWIVIKNPMIVKKESSYVSSTSNLQSQNKTTENEFLYSIENELLWCIFCMYFSSGWSPVVTIIDDRENFNTIDFAGEKGTFMSKGELDKLLNPSSSYDSIQGFYLPPQSEFKILRDVRSERMWTQFIIKNPDVLLKLEFSADVPNHVCYIKAVYEKKNMWKNYFGDYSKYDRWFLLIWRIIQKFSSDNMESPSKLSMIKKSNVTQL